MYVLMDIFKFCVGKTSAPIFFFGEKFSNFRSIVWLGFHYFKIILTIFYCSTISVPLSPWFDAQDTIFLVLPALKPI